jgi:hypothetical protein
VTVVVHADLNGVLVPITLDDDTLAAIAAALPQPETPPDSPFMTIPEAALYLGCGYRDCDGYRKQPCDGDDCGRCGGTGQVVNRQRVDDLLSARRLERVKDGGRTLIRRSDLDRHLGRFGEGAGSSA